MTSSASDAPLWYSDALYGQPPSLNVWPEMQRLLLACLAWLTTTWQGTLALLVLIYVLAQAPGPKRLVAWRAAVAAHLKAILGIAITIALTSSVTSYVSLPDVHHYEINITVSPLLTAIVTSVLTSGLMAVFLLVWLLWHRGSFLSSMSASPISGTSNGMKGEDVSI